MWKYIGFSALLLTKYSSEVTADGVVKGVTGSPFRFAPPVIPDKPPKEGQDTIWWPTTGRAPKLNRKSAGHLLEDRETLIHTDLSYPNPFSEPERCVAFPKINHTWLCDPDGLMTHDEETRLESRLLKLRDTRSHKCPQGKDEFYQAAVAVATDIVVPENETPQQATDGFAHALLRRWGVGNKGCHDGILLVYVKNLRTVAVATRSGVESQYISEETKKLHPTACPRRVSFDWFYWRGHDLGGGCLDRTASSSSRRNRLDW